MAGTFEQLTGAGLEPAVSTILATNDPDAIFGLNIAKAAATNKNIIIDTDITLISNVTVNSALTILKGGSITTNGYTLTINGPFSAGAFQCFITSGLQVVFGNGSTLYALIEWFGPAADGTTDNSTAIQLALNIAAKAKIPVIAMSHVTGNGIQTPPYRCTGITMPQHGQLISNNTRRSYARFLANGSGAMFTLTHNGDDFCTFKGIQMDGNATASCCVNPNGSDYPLFEDCAFYNATKLIDCSSGATGMIVNRCELNGASGVTTDLIYISGASIGIYIDKCTLISTTTYGIRSDTSWTGDNLIIRDCIIGCICTDVLKLQRNSGSGAHLMVLIEGNRFDGGPSNSNINIGQLVQAVIIGNEITGSSTYSITTDGQYNQIIGNMFSQSTSAAINITSNAQDTWVAPNQIWGALGGGVRVADAGSRSVIERQQQLIKGTTANRPSGLAAPYATQYGLLYLDTTLDADGKPIWWNGVAWVDATGAVV